MLSPSLTICLRKIFLNWIRFLGNTFSFVLSHQKLNPLCSLLFENLRKFITWNSNVYHVILPNDPITFDKYKHVSTLDFFLLDRVIIAFSRFVYAYQYFLSLIRVNGKQNKGFFPKDKRCLLRKKRCDLSQPQRQRQHIVCNFFSFEARDWCMCAFVRVVCCVVKIVQ